MKPEDINYILNIVPNFSYGRKQGLSDEDTIIKSNQVWHELEDALEKQVPKKPERLNAFKSIGKCGGCEKVISTRTASVYCQYCGNRVDWGYEE